MVRPDREDQTGMNGHIDSTVDPGGADSTRELRRFLGLLALLFIGWCALAWLIVPGLIRLTYDGVSIPLLSSFMAGRESTPIEEYLESWARYRDGGTLALLLFIVAASPIVFTMPPLAERLRRSGATEGAQLRSVGFVLAGIILAICMIIPELVHFDPVAYVYAITEDSWVEYGTFVVFGMAGLLFIRAAWVEQGWRKLGLIAFALAALFVSFEEISWAQRIIGFSTPDELRHYNFQAELTLHNIWFPSHAAVAIGLLCLTILLPVLRRRWKPLDDLITQFGIPVPPLFLWPVFFVTAALLIGATKELSELALGTSFLFLALDRSLRPGGERDSIRGAGIGFPVAGASLAIAALVTAATVAWTPPSTLLKGRLNGFAAYHLLERGLVDEAETLFDYLETRPDLRTNRTRIDFGHLLLSRGERGRAEQVLNLALQDIEATTPTTPFGESRRLINKGEILALLGQTEAADEQVNEALAIAEALLQSARSANDSVDAHWSAAQALYLLGRVDAAAEQAALACARSSDLSFHVYVRKWSSRVAGLDDRLSGCIERQANTILRPSTSAGGRRPTA